MPDVGDLRNYRFLPWLRRGLSTQIGRSEGAGSHGTPRAAVSVKIRFNSDDSLESTTSLELYGAGEVVALDARTVVRTWPVRDASDAESNGWPLIEFEQPDLPWRYTPARAGGDRLRPWLALVVLRTDEILDQQHAGPQRTLPTVTVSSHSLPDLSQAWAWAHVAVSGGQDVDPSSLQELLATEPHRVVSRLLSPRRLEPRSSYVACLVPALKRGLLAGLGQNPDDYGEGPQHLRVDGLEPAWSGGTARVELPVYFQWSFQTGDGDFASLVHRLHPTTLPASFGTRPLDASAPGVGLAGVLTTPLALEGAFAAPTPRPSSMDPVQRDAWVARLRPLLNRPAELERNALPEQVLVPPLYGRFHALQATLEPAGEPRWFQELNADPTLRVAAGIGAKVVQDQRQHLLASAWQQVEKVRRINAELRQAQLARESARRVKQKHFDNASTEVVLQMTSSVLARLRASPTTIQARLRSSPLTPGLLEAQWRKLTRPLGPLGLRLGPSARTITRTLVRRTNQGTISAAPPAPVPSRLATPERVFAPFAMAEQSAPALPWWLLGLAVLIVGAVLMFLGVFLGVGSGWLLLVAMLGAAAIAAAVRRSAAASSSSLSAQVRGRPRARDAGAPAAWPSSREEVATALRDGTLTGAQVRATPLPAGFVLAEVKRSTTGAAAGATRAPSPAEREASAAAFRSAAADLLDELAQPPIARAALVQANLGELRARVLAAVDPRATIEVPLVRRLSVDPKLSRRGDPLDPILAAPDFPQPMYQPLRDLSQQWLLPGLAEVPPNSLTLLQANARFIEAYMVGLNHEMARVLLWSEYPTDQRGTYFRRFWDTASRLPEDGAPDIPPIHTWSRTAALGESLDASLGGPPLLMLVRGDVLHRYPNTSVYAVRAQLGDDGHLALGTDKKDPLFRGSLSPDVAFFAFDLDANTARGSNQPGNEGWFFVLQEPPGEPRFGLDVGDPGLRPPARSFDALSWGHLAADATTFASIRYIDLNAALPDLRHITDAGGLAWHADGGLGPTGALASHLARIGLRRPARVAVHATEMLHGLPAH